MVTCRCSACHWSSSRSRGQSVAQAYIAADRRRLRNVQIAVLQERGGEHRRADVGALHEVDNAAKAAAFFVGQPANVNVGSAGVLEHQAHEFPRPWMPGQ